jgi:hypothetical protein
MVSFPHGLATESHEEPHLLQTNLHLHAVGLGGHVHIREGIACFGKASVRFESFLTCGTRTYLPVVKRASFQLNGNGLYEIGKTIASASLKNKKTQKSKERLK